MVAERKRAAVFVVLIFLCGLLSGVVGANLWRRMTVSADTVQTPHLGSVPSPPNHKHVVEWFTKQLSLTPEQTQQLSQILEETRKEYNQQEMQIESIRQESDTRIRALLNDQQKAQFDELLRERAERESQQKSKTPGH